MSDKRMKFMNTFVDNLTMDEAVKEIDLLIQQKKRSYVVTPNVDHIVRLEKDKEFKQVYDDADLILTDGMPLVWYSHLCGRPIREKVSGSDLFPAVCEMASQKKYSMYFLGAAEGIAARAAEIVKTRYPGLEIVGTYSPSYGFEKNVEEVSYIIHLLSEANPDILILALGSPKQEKFYYHIKDQLNIPITLSIGATLDFVAGSIRRSPRWMSNHGLEWVYRILQEPSRMSKRYFIDDSAIFGLFWKYRKQK